MNWNNLQNKLCPNCGASLQERDFTYGSGFVCSRVSCDFKIGIDKFNQLSNGQNKNKN